MYPLTLPTLFPETKVQLNDMPKLIELSESWTTANLPTVGELQKLRLAQIEQLTLVELHRCHPWRRRPNKGTALVPRQKIVRLLFSAWLGKKEELWFPWLKNVAKARSWYKQGVDAGVTPPTPVPAPVPVYREAKVVELGEITCGRSKRIVMPRVRVK